uniref:Alcohol dehydrogenase n=1 Tax=Chenopodium quinoa TaxID=63459 RepID=A0A803MXH4_CHEQI
MELQKNHKADVNTPKRITAGKPLHCKAAIAREAGQPLVIEEVIVAPPKAHEVRIKIICTSLCYSDITFWKLKDFPGCYPRIFGHEAVGIVESVGEGVDEVVEGDYVLPVFIADCGDCNDCKSSESNLCSKLPFKISPWMPREDSSRFTDLNGETLFHFLSVSSFSQYTVVNVAHLTKIDPSIPPNRACLLSCGVSTGIGAAWRAANVKPGSTVAIFGIGAIGLGVAEGARLCGATKIIAVDINPERFEFGKKFGVTDFINPNNCEDNKTVSQGWGKTIVLGVDKPDAQLSLLSMDVLLSGKSIKGSIYGGLKAKSDVPILVKRYLDKEVRLDEFVSHEMKFDEINKAFELLIEGKCLRCVIWMD